MWTIYGRTMNKKIRLYADDCTAYRKILKNCRQIWIDWGSGK
jgi:hypothetical protein